MATQISQRMNFNFLNKKATTKSLAAHGKSSLINVWPLQHFIFIQNPHRAWKMCVFCCFVSVADSEHRTQLSFCLQNCPCLALQRLLPAEHFWPDRNILQSQECSGTNRPRWFLSLFPVFRFWSGIPVWPCYRDWKVGKVRNSLKCFQVFYLLDREQTNNCLEELACWQWFSKNFQTTNHGLREGSTRNRVRREQSTDLLVPLAV